MDYTNNYNLKKPNPIDDFYDRQNDNDNMDIIDEELKKANEKQGNLTLLQTQEKSSLVGAVNELASQSAQIENEQLKKTSNLSDLSDIGVARTNLGLTGNSNTSHYHDGRYVQTRLNSGKLQFWNGNSWEDVMSSMVKSVQRGILSISANSADVTISSVNLSKAFVLINQTPTSNRVDATVRGRLFNSTTLRFDRFTGLSGETVNVSWEVVEYV